MIIKTKRLSNIFDYCMLDNDTIVVNNKSVESGGGGGGYSCDTKHGNIGSDHEWVFLGSKICDFRGLW